MPPPARPLSSTLGLLDGCWLDINCGCGRSAVPAVRLLATQYGTGMRLKDLVRRLRCATCQARPAAVWLQVSPHSSNAGMAGATLGWRLDLLRCED